MTSPAAPTDHVIGVVRDIALRPITVWIAFVLVHLWLGLVNLYAPSGPMGDVTRVYKFWMDQALLQNFWVGIDTVWVYPILALLPMVAAAAFGPDQYGSTWLTMVMLLNAVAFGFVTGWGRSRERVPVAWWWVGFLLLLGPIAMGRIDAITVPFAMVAVLLIVSRPGIAGILLTVAAWIKVWPAAIAAAAVTVASQRLRIIVGGVAVSVVIALTVVVFGGGSNLFSFATIQGDRSLQLEAPVATPWVWATVLGIPGSEIRQNYVLATREVAGPGAHLAGDVVGLLMPIAFVIIVLLLWRARRLAVRQGRLTTGLEQRLILVASFALTAALIVFNKVGTPQYMLWLAPIVAVGLIVDPQAWRKAAGWLAGVCFATTLVFPVLYMPLIDGDPFSAGVLLARNVMVVGLFVWSVVVLWRAGSETVRERDAAVLPAPAVAIAGV